MDIGGGWISEKLWDRRPEVWQVIPCGHRVLAGKDQLQGPAGGTQCHPYLRVLQLGLQSGEVLGELAGLAVRLGEKTCHIVQLDLCKEGRHEGHERIVTTLAPPGRFRSLRSHFEARKRAEAAEIWAKAEELQKGPLCRPGSPWRSHLKLGDLVGQLRAHSLSLVELHLQLLELGLHFLPLVLGVPFALQQDLHLVGQLPSLTLQGLLGLLKVGFYLVEKEAKV